MYSISKKIKKGLIWVLLSLLFISTFVSILVPSEKALAADPDPSNPGFFKATSSPKIPGSDNLKVTINSDKTLTLTWEISKSTVQSLNVIANGAFPSGFLIKSKNSAPYECFFDQQNSPSQNVKQCQGSQITLKEEPNLHKNPSLNLVAQDWQAWINSSSSVIKYTLTDRTVNADNLPASTKVGAQTISMDAWNKRYSGVNLTETETSPVNLGDEFSDTNIDAYIQNKVKAYPKDSKPRPDFAPISDTDIQGFKDFMNSWKNTADGTSRIIYKRIEQNPNEDPFQLAGAKDDNGVFHSLLTQDEILALYDKYYKNYNSDTADNMDNFVAKYREIQRNFMDLVANQYQKNSCEDMWKQIETSDQYKELYLYLGMIAGGAAGGGAGYLLGGGANVATIAKGAAVGAGGGAVVANAVQTVISSGDINDANNKSAVLLKEFFKLIYASMYLQWKEASLGLKAYHNNPNLIAGKGYNPFKHARLTGLVEVMFEQFLKCLDRLQEAINALKERTGLGTDDTCGLPLKDIGKTEYWIAKALCGLLNIIGELAKMIVDGLFYSVFNAYHPPDNLKLSLLAAPLTISQAHAQDKLEGSIPVSPLIDAFTNNADPKWAWVIGVWKFSLGLTNLFLVVVLLFLGIVNILHIQYDTYAIKKALPYLILGVILANFSLLIMRMMIDASNILTKSFMGGTPGDAVHDLIVNFEIKKNQLPDVASGMGWNTVGGLFLALFFSIFAIAAFFILGVMFYIRYAAIILLGIAAPLAFVAMAFPPTQSLFKQWWGWTTKFIFMKPVAMFLIFVAVKAKGSGAGTGITGWLIIIALVYMAILVPWKMGGAVMAMWGGAMGSIFGTKKGGWARNGAEKWYNRKKTDAGTWAMKKIPGVGRLAGRLQNLEEGSKNARETELARQKRLNNERAKGIYTLGRKEKAAEDSLGKTQEARFSHAFENAEDTGLSEEILRKHTGAGSRQELKEKYSKIEHDLGEAESALKKRGDIDSSNQAMLAMVLHQIFTAKLEGKTIDFGGKQLSYDDARTQLSSLKNEHATALNESEKPAIQDRINELEQSIYGFEAENTDVNYDHYLDKNRFGRMQARVNPRLAEEMETILKSESISQILNALKKGGGTSEFRFSGEDVENYLKGNFEAIKIPARYGIQSYVMALQAKVGTQGIDQLEAISGITELVDNISPGTKTQIIEQAKQGMGEKNIQELETSLGKSVSEITNQDIESFDMRPGSIQRDFARRLAVAIRSHPALGAAGSPGSYVGKGPSVPVGEKLMAAQKDDDLDKIVTETAGGAETILREVERTGVESTLTSLESDMIVRINPTVKIDNDALRQQILQTVSQSVDIDDLQSQLSNLNIELSPTVDMQVFPQLKVTAQKVRTAQENLKKLSVQSLVTKTLPHYNNAIKKMTIEDINTWRDMIGEITKKISDRVNNGQRLSEDPSIGEDLKSILAEFGHIKDERDAIATTLDTNPDRAIDILRSKSRVLEAAEEIKTEFNKTIQNATERKIYIPLSDPKSEKKQRGDAAFRFESSPARLAETIKGLLSAKAGLTTPPPESATQSVGTPAATPAPTPASQPAAEPEQPGPAGRPENANDLDR